MAMTLKPIRRVVTGNDAQGRSRVLFDGPAPNVNPGAVAASAAMTDLWVFERCPAPLSGERDDGNLPFNFEPPHSGGHLRIVQSAGKPPGYDPATDKTAVPLHAPRQRPGGTWDKGGQNAFSSPVHQSETVDYGILLEGERGSARRRRARCGLATWWCSRQLARLDQPAATASWPST
jgi:hypothetical protein